MAKNKYNSVISFLEIIHSRTGLLVFGNSKNAKSILRINPHFESRQVPDKLHRLPTYKHPTCRQGETI